MLHRTVYREMYPGWVYRAVPGPGSAPVYPALATLPAGAPCSCMPLPSVDGAGQERQPGLKTRERERVWASFWASWVFL